MKLTVHAQYMNGKFWLAAALLQLLIIKNMAFILARSRNDKSIPK